MDSRGTLGSGLALNSENNEDIFGSVSKVVYCVMDVCATHSNPLINTEAHFQITLVAHPHTITGSRERGLLKVLKYFKH